MERKNPETPRIIDGMNEKSIFIKQQGTNIKFIMNNENNSLITFLTNKSFEKKLKKKLPSTDPLPIF